MRRHTRAFSLVELLVVVAIIGALAVLAYPSYRDYTARAARTEARSMLLRIGADQEKFYLQNATYANTLTAFGYPSNAVPTDSGKYRVSITAGDQAGFTVRADYENGDREAGKCSWYELDESGARTSGPMDPEECWAR